MKTLKPFLSLEVTKQENIFIELQAIPERELKLTWVLKIMLLLCQMQIKKILLMLLLELALDPPDKDAWPLPALFLLERHRNGFQKL